MLRVMDSDLWVRALGLGFRVRGLYNRFVYTHPKTSRSSR